jgi:hypothetical protein
MRLRIILLAMMIGSCAPPPPVTPRLATQLVGRIAGAPKDCLPIRTTENLQIADGDRSTLIYGSGKTVWANRLGPSCGFGLNDLLIFEPTVGQYCRGDIVRSVDRYSHIPGPSCVLGDFVPYTRP